MTNAVRHAGPAVRVRAVVEAVGEALRVSVVDDGPDGAAPAPGEGTGGPGGFGIAGMRERARSVGGTVEAGPRAPGPGFAVTALLPARPSTSALASSAAPRGALS
ncbi:ATP-binding protein [Streptomyces sp. NPDC053499]|uniref:ATP-binding protein n=1 Tax=Streptomyces sp. NPDC053499 TaxID=3365707 RepID=UPI0037D773CE